MTRTAIAKSRATKYACSVTEPPEHIWEQQVGESDIMYTFFCIFRDMGMNRSLEGAREIADNEGTVYSWADRSNRYDWWKRTAAYDQFHLKKMQDEYEEERIEWRERRRKLLREINEIVVNELIKLKQQLIIDEEYSLTPAQLRLYASMVLDSSRTEFGEVQPPPKVLNVDNRRLTIERIEIVKDYDNGHSQRELYTIDGESSNA